MDPAFPARLRRLWLDVHLWIGLGLLAVLAPLGLSGSILVFHDAVERALHAERYAVSGTAQRPLEAYAAAAQGAFGPRARLAEIRIPQAPGDPVVAVGRLAGAPPAGERPRSLNAWIDPPTARVLATGEPARGFTMTVHRFHGSLMLPGFGRKLVGWLGWAMFASCATGLWLWWPRRGGALAGLRWRRGASQLFNLHHMLGFWICAPLAALSATGVILSFPQTAQALAGVRAASPGDRVERSAWRNGPPLEAPTTPLARALAAAQALRPTARITTVDWPQQGSPAWRIELRAPGDAPARVVVDDASGRARPAPPAGGAPRSAFLAWARRIHDGADLGPLWRTVIAVAGLAPTALGLTGCAMWLRRRTLRQALART